MFGSRNRKGFTLIELLVVIGIIAILVAMILPAIQSARQAARRTANKNNLKQIGTALHNYLDVHHVFPPGWIGGSDQADRNGMNGFGWCTMILPNLDQAPLYNSINFSLSITDPVNTAAWRVALPVLRSPSDPSSEFWDIHSESDPATVLASLPSANYVGSFGSKPLEDCDSLPLGQSCKGDGIFYHNSSVRLSDIKDGTNYTIMVGERRTDLTKTPEWHSTWVGVVAGGEESFARILGVADHTPNDLSGHFDDYSSVVEEGVLMLFADGKVKSINSNIDLQIFQSLATRIGGEIIPSDF